MPNPGDKFGPYRLVRILGRGGFGEVWLAEENKKAIRNRQVALKILFRKFDLETVQREVKVWLRANGDPAIVPFIDALIIGEQAGLVSEFRQEGSLQHWLQKHQGRAPSTAVAVAMICNILRGVEHLHAKGIIHRDLKPANVLLYERKPQITDFGIARLHEGLSDSSTVKGTPEYMAPEAFQGERGPSLDLWSVAVMLHQLLTGKFPPTDPNANQDSTGTSLPPLAKLPRGLRDSVTRALAKDPQNRYATATEFRESLESVAPRYTEAAMEQSLETYRRWVRTFCSEVNFANLPEMERTIATTEFQLQKFYTALRVRVETSSPPRSGETEEDLRLNLNHGPENASLKSSPNVFLGERLKLTKRLVVLGGTGAGKTTLLKWVALVYLLGLKQNPDFKALPEVKTLPEGTWLPIFVRCRDLDEASIQGSPGDFLRRILHKAGLQPQQLDAASDALHDRLDTGRAILLVDGLDEIDDLALRRRCCEQLQDIRRVYPLAQLIVTARIAGYRAMRYRFGDEFEHLTISELSAKDKDLFAERWCACTESIEKRAAAITSLKQSIYSHPQIERLTGNPLMLTTLALVKRRFNKLPRNRAELYAETFRVLLSRNSGDFEPLEDDEVRPQVAYLAFAMCKRGTQQLREDEVLKILAEMRADYSKLRAVRHTSPPEEFLKRLTHGRGLLHQTELIQSGGRTYLYEFCHPAFQEYLAGLALAELCYPGRIDKQPLDEYVRRLVRDETPSNGASATGPNHEEPTLPDRWNEALRLCVACCLPDVVEEVICGILEPMDGESMRARAVLAALCLADEPKSISDETALRILQLFVKHIAERDGRGGTPTSVDLAALELGRSAFKFNNRVTVRNLLQEQLLEAFRRESSVKRERFGVLFAVNSYHTAPEGGKALERWLDDRVRELGGDEVQTISACLAIMEVGYHGKPNMRDGVAEQLLALLDRGGAAAHAAAWALQYLRVRKGNKCMPWDAEPTALERLTKVVANASADQRAVVYAAQILGRKQFVPAVPALIERLSGADGTDVVYAACRGLVAIGKPAIEPLMAALDGDPDPYLRGWASAVLEQLDPDDVHWEKYLNDDIRAIRCKALGRLLRRAGIDGIERQLLSRNLDGKPPWLDPADLIDPQRVKQAAEAVHLTAEDVESRYEQLAQKVPVPITWVARSG
jgi:serine/threonine protein kinase